FVFIMSVSYDSIHHAKFSIYYKNRKKILNNGKLKEGDAFWEVTSPGFNNKDFWTTTERFPYWISGKALIKATLDEKEIKEITRFELMNLS
ncbi:MAG TPA: hypothetical protein VMZ91_03640, partial [Candidatus Paceibacterota bacterium]|nr:hypothetical protein [Candidatus Paceibacterota bacterium]